MKEFKINKNDSGQRVDKFIPKTVPKLPKSLLYKYIRLKRIKVNKKRCEISQVLAENDMVEMYINDEFFEIKKNTEFLTINSSLNIIYEDENILIVNKPAGTDVHRGSQNNKETLIDIINLICIKKTSIIRMKKILFLLQFATDWIEIRPDLSLLPKMLSL